MKKLLLLIFCFCIITSLFAKEKITVTVYDEEGKSLSFVTVSCKFRLEHDEKNPLAPSSLALRKGASTTTNAQGQFTLKISKKDIVEIHLPGYWNTIFTYEYLKREQKIVVRKNKPRGMIPMACCNEVIDNAYICCTREYFLEGVPLITANINTRVATNKKQKIKGTIQDENGAPLAYANIWIEKSGKGTTSDESGEFSLECQPSDTIKVSYLGYQEAVFSSKDILKNKQIQLQKGISLNEIVVSAEYSTQRHIVCCCEGFILEKSRLFTPSEDQLPTDWTIFPNPTVGPITINAKEPSWGSIQLVNSQGRLVQQYHVQQFPFQLDLSPFPNGTYFLRFKAKNQLELIGRVVKIQE